MLTANEIRRRFLDYFKKHGHTEVASSSLIPRDDPSLLFTNAGMVQFKKVFCGQEKRDYKRATTSQKCLRVGGKHNDLDNVGRTARHHTFFEMLGNFSFGDYFKEDAIRFAWAFITEELKLPKEKLYITVYKDDDEAFELWQKVAGVAPERIFRLGDKDNFWSMGDTGPCGPCSEIHYDQGADMACGPDCGIGTCDCDRFLEIWNLVFMQFDQQPDGTRVPLPHPSIDTGMGLERIAAVCQGVRSNYDTDLFQTFIQYMAELAGVRYHDSDDTDTALRVIADHSRAIAFMIADGILPSNEGRGYVLRRLIRRAFRFGRLMGMQDPFLYKTALKVVEVMGEGYPELCARADFMARVVREEEERFSSTLDKGLAMLEEEMDALAAKGETADTVDQYIARVPHTLKPDLLAALLKERGAKRVIVFARTRHRADAACRKLKRAGYHAEAIHSDRSQNQRKRALDNFASGETDILVATDVLARGIDVDEVSYVVNYDVPVQAEDYVHRIGRTGRAGAEGFAVTFVSPENKDELAAIECAYPPTGAELTHRDLLGGMMGIGLIRERVGDILVGEKAAQLVCLRDAAPIILSQFDQAGRYRLKLREIPLGELAPAPAEVKLIHDTVSTLRLDAVLSSGFSLARGKAADAVTGGRVSLNHRECLKPDRAVAQGDVITCRGLGKCVLKTVGGQSRKGRIIIEIERYL